LQDILCLSGRKAKSFIPLRGNQGGITEEVEGYEEKLVFCTAFHLPEVGLRFLPSFREGKN